MVDAGSTTSLPGGSGSYVLYQSDETLLVSAGGHNESIKLPSDATVRHSDSTEVASLCSTAFLAALVAIAASSKHLLVCCIRLHRLLIVAVACRSQRAMLDRHMLSMSTQAPTLPRKSSSAFLLGAGQHVVATPLSAPSLLSLVLTTLAMRATLHKLASLFPAITLLWLLWQRKTP